MYPAFEGDGVYELAHDSVHKGESASIRMCGSSHTLEGADIYYPRAPALAGEPQSAIGVFCGGIVNDARFGQLVVFLIFINSIMMGIGTFDVVRENQGFEELFDVVDKSMLIFFSVEMCMHFAYRGAWGIIQDGWLTFDVIVVSMSWVVMGGQVMRTMRALRAFRLVTRVKNLRDLVHVLLGVVPRLLMIALLLMLVFYVFGVMFTQHFKDLYREGYTSQDYFSRLDRTCFTLFQIMTLDNWSVITKEVMSAYQWAWLPILVFVILSTFIVVNMVVAGVISDAFSSLQTNDIKKRIAQMHRFGAPRSELERLERKIDALTTSVQWLIQEQLKAEAQSLKRTTSSPPKMPHPKAER